MDKKIKDSKVKVKADTSKSIPKKSSKKVEDSKVSEKKKVVDSKKKSKSTKTTKKSKTSKNNISIVTGIFIGLLVVGLFFFFSNSTESSSNVVATYDGIELSEVDLSLIHI